MQLQGSWCRQASGDGRIARGVAIPGGVGAESSGSGNGAADTPPRFRDESYVLYKVNGKLGADEAAFKPTIGPTAGIHAGGDSNAKRGP